MSIKHINAADFENDVLIESQSTPVLVDFWADWCEPCKQLMPILESLVQSYNGKLKLVKINTDENQEFAMSYGIRSLPTVLLFNKGEVVEQIIGVQPESAIKDLVSPYISMNAETPETEDESNDSIEKAQELIISGDYKAAAELLVKDESLESKLLLINVLIHQNEIDNAIMTFENLSTEDKEQKSTQFTKIQLDLIILANKSDNQQLIESVPTLLKSDAEQGIENLLELLKHSKEDAKSEIKQCLILSFNLINDAKTVSKLRRKMASLIF